MRDAIFDWYLVDMLGYSVVHSTEREHSDRIWDWTKPQPLSKESEDSIWENYWENVVTFQPRRNFQPPPNTLIVINTDIVSGSNSNDVQDGDDVQDDDDVQDL